MRDPYDSEDDPQAFGANLPEPPFDPEYYGVPNGVTEDQPAVDGQQAASGQPVTGAGQANAEEQAANGAGTPPTDYQQEMLGATDGEQDPTERDPDDWATGDQPATEAQKSYIDAMAKQAGEQIPANLTKAQASEQIDRLKKITGM